MRGFFPLHFSLHKTPADKTYSGSAAFAQPKIDYRNHSHADGDFGWKHGGLKKLAQQISDTGPGRAEK